MDFRIWVRYLSTSPRLDNVKVRRRVMNAMTAFDLQVAGSWFAIRDDVSECYANTYFPIPRIIKSSRLRRSNCRVPGGAIARLLEACKHDASATLFAKVCWQQSTS